MGELMLKVYSYHYFVHIYHAEQDKIDAYQNCFYIKKFLWRKQTQIEIGKSLCTFYNSFER